MGMHKHGKDSAKGKACQKYKSEGRRERNKARKSDNLRRWTEKKRAHKSFG